MSFRIRQLNGFPLCVIDQRDIKGDNLSPLKFLVFFALKILAGDQQLLRTFAGDLGIVSKTSNILFSTEERTSQTKTKSMISSLWVDGECQNLIVGAFDHRTL